jgi:hypothetical protein
VILLYCQEAEGKEERMWNPGKTVIAGIALMTLSGCASSGIRNISSENTKDQPSRRIVDGVILHTGLATGDPEEAIFKAEQQAIRAIILECSIPTRDLVVYDKGYKSGYAVATVGIPVDSCEEAMKASPEKRKLLTNQPVLEDQARYMRMLDQRLGFRDKQDRAPTNDEAEGDCKAEYRRLMDQANRLAQENTPPGNMNQGRAAELLQQAQSVAAGCD